VRRAHAGPVEVEPALAGGDEATAHVVGQPLPGGTVGPRRAVSLQVESPSLEALGEPGEHAYSLTLTTTFFTGDGVPAAICGMCTSWGQRIMNCPADIGTKSPSPSTATKSRLSS
jgi:hypothetical protein